MRKACVVLTSCIMVLLSFSAFGADLQSNLEDTVHEFELQNGMKWLLVQRRQAPVFSGVVMVKVGGVDEETDEAGIAHMLEHMAFKGSKVFGTSDWEKEKPILDQINAIGKKITIEANSTEPDQIKIEELKRELRDLKRQHEKYYLRNEIWGIMSRNGAHDLNAYTSKDVTAYHASMPINRLELWAAVLSEMVTNPVFREFYVERDVVAEERQSGIDNNPDGKLAEKLLNGAFQEGPYKWATIGSEKNINSYLQEDALKFMERHYIPSRMVGVLVGDIDIGKTKKIIKKYFGKMAKRKSHEPLPEFKNTGGGIQKFSFDAQPSIVIAYHKPTLPNPDEYTFDVITELMCDGRASRLYRKLVIEDKIAQRISCSDAFPGSRLPNLFVLWVEPMNGTSPESILSIVDDELNKLKSESISKDELDRIRKKVAASFLFGLETNEGLAQGLAKFQTIFGNWKLLIDYPKNLSKVNAEDVKRISKKYLKDKNRTVVIREKK